MKPETETDLPRKLRDVIRLALQGKQLTHRTLSWLVEAFEFEKQDAHRVWNAFSGGSVTDLGETGISFTLRTDPVPLVKPQVLRTTTLFSRYYINSAQSLSKIETSHVVVALENDVDTFAYSPRDTAYEALGIAGGTFVQFHESSAGFIGVEFKLDRPLRKGQHASLQYVTNHVDTNEPCTHIRRAVRKRMENIDIRVLFANPPKRAWWCAWDDYAEGRTVQEIEAAISPRSELHQFVPHAEEAVMGFRWEW
ncbi:MAG: hypothetical protein ABIP96_06060 [Patescibacteria group bacterium]